MNITTYIPCWFFPVLNITQNSPPQICFPKLLPFPKLTLNLNIGCLFPNCRPVAQPFPIPQVIIFMQEYIKVPTCGNLVK